MRKHGYALAALPAILFAIQDASAHPSMLDGGSLTDLYTINQTTGAVTTNNANIATRGFADGVRIGHGCALTGPEKGSTGNEKPINRSAYIWPAAEGVNAYGGKDNGMAPWSANSSGSTDPNSPLFQAAAQIGYRPSVVIMADYRLDGKDASASLGTFTYQGTQVTLGSQLVHADGSPINSLRGLIKPLGNAPYFLNFQLNRNIDGFWETKPRMQNGKYAEVNYNSPSLPGLTVTGTNFMATGDIKFGPQSCSRKLVIRPAGIDVCTNKLNKEQPWPDGDHINTWMGGRTEKFTVGDAGQQNNWSAPIILNRDVKNNPYPAQCKDKVNGDSDLVAMPTHYEINNFLPFPGLKGSR